MICFLALAATFTGGLMPKVHAYCIGADPSLPGYNPKHYTVPFEYRRALFVVTARVTKETWLGFDGKPKPLKPPFQNGAIRPWGFDPYMGAFYDVKVLHVFKGRPSSRLRLFSENSTGRFWLFVGKEYLLFVTRDTFDKPVDSQLTIDNCGNSALLPKGDKTLRQVERIAKRK